MKRLTFVIPLFLIRKTCLFLSFVVLAYSLRAYNLHQLSSKEGLSNSSILSICQDSDRFMWFGSVDGLNVYDGMNMTIFKPHANAQGSLSGNLIEEVWEGEKDVIWINTNYGLNRFNKITKEIESYDAFEGRCYLAKTSTDEIFAINDNHTIHYYDKQKKLFVPIPYPGIRKDEIQRVFIDNTNILWIVTNKGVVYNTLISFSSGIPVINKLTDFAHDCTIRHAFMENNQIYFVDQDFNLFEMDAALRRKRLIKNLKKELEERGTVSSIIKDNDDYLIAFQTNGLIRIQHTQEEGLSSYGVKQIDIFCGVFCLYKDEEQDIIWIGTDGQGVYMHTRDSFSARSITFDQLQFSIQKPIRTFFLDKERTLWVGTKGDGVFFIKDYNSEEDISSKEMKHVTTFNSALFNNSVYAFAKSRRNLFWIGGDGPGLNYYSYKERKIKRVASVDAEPILYIHSIREVNDSTLWLASVGAGIYKVIVSGGNDNPVIKSIRRFTFQKDEMSYNYFFTAYQENDSIMWFGNRGYGLMRLNIDNETFTKVKTQKQDVRTINDVFSIYQDKKGSMWTGTSFGILKLLHYNPSNQEVTFANYSEIEGLPNNTIHGILEDERGCLWVSTNSGIVQFDTENERFRVHNHNNGLNVFEFSDGAYLKDEQTGTLFFGGTNGFVTITPDIYPRKEFVPQVFFTRLKIYENEYNLNDFLQTKENGKELQLTYDQNFFSVSFIALDYMNGQNCKYYYNLENFNTKWIDNGYSNTVNFTNISPGEYILHVECSNGDLMSDVYSLTIVILPPWYLTIWAYICYVLLAIIALVGCIQLIRARYIRKKEMMIEKVQQEQKEEIYESKLRFFTNITHEFSTPLTLIYGPCNRILSYEKSDGFIKKYANMIMKNAERLNSLIQELIEFRRIETGHKACKIEQLNITELSNGIAESFIGLAEENNIHYQSGIDENIYWNSDKSCFTKILANLLSNALKYTPSGGKISLLIRMEHDALDIKVLNTGKGIKDEDLPYVFDRYRVLENFERQSQKGFTSRNGLGLAICHNMVKLLDGEIEVMSIPNEYTEFQVVLPLKERTVGEDTDRVDADLPKIRLGAADENFVKTGKAELESSRLTIFVIDDDPEIRWFVSDVLNKHYNVISIEKPELVFEKLESVQPQLIISDIMMPVLDGISLMKQIKENRRTAHIPFILLSAKNTPEEQTEGIAGGAEAYIVKPFNVDYLLSVVDRLLQRQDELKDYYRSAISAYEFTNGKFIHKEDKEFFEKMVDVIGKNLANTDFTSEKLAVELGLSSRHLYRRLKDITDQTPANLIKEYRLKVVEKLLITSQSTVDEIMYKAGFNNRGSFYRLFSLKYGTTPQKYRNSRIQEGVQHE